MRCPTSRRPRPDVSRREVVVTGLGATTPLGGDVASTWEAMVAGRSGVVALTQDWAQQLPVRIAAPMKVDPGSVIDRIKLRRLDRSEAAALIAAHQAWADAGLADAGVDGERLAVVVGSGIGGAPPPLQHGDPPGGAPARQGGPPPPPQPMAQRPRPPGGLGRGGGGGGHPPARPRPPRA